MISSASSSRMCRRLAKPAPGVVHRQARARARARARSPPGSAGSPPPARARSPRAPRRPRGSRPSSASSSGRSAVAGDTFTAMNMPAGSPCERSQASRIAHSSSSAPSPTSCASANHCSGPRPAGRRSATAPRSPRPRATSSADDRLEDDVELSVPASRRGSGRACVLAPRGARFAACTWSISSWSTPRLDHAVEDRVARRGGAQRRHRASRRARRAPRSRPRPARSIAIDRIVVRPARVREHARVRGRARGSRAQRRPRRRARCTSTSATSGCSALGQLGRPRGARGHADQLESVRRESSAAAVPAAIQLLVVRDQERGQAPLPWAQSPPG